MPVLTLEERARAIGHLEAGTEVKDVCEMFSTTRKACYNLIECSKELSARTKCFCSPLACCEP